MIHSSQIEELGEELYDCMRAQRVVKPLTERFSEISIQDAYQISRHYLDLRLARDSEKMVGKKIGVTSDAVQSMLGVYEPDFGFLTDTMRFSEGDVRIGDLIQPRAEAEIAFKLNADLNGPGVSADDVLAATDTVMACFEIVDSRIENWQIRIQDTIADNASCGVFVLSSSGVDPRQIDLAAAKVTVQKNGEFLSEGEGRAVQGSPLNSVAWLANTLGVLGMPLKAGEIILSGSLVPLEPIVIGDQMSMSIPGIGSLDVNFVG